ncbi:hypothetical protein [Microbacterium enclense]|uniref:hypothetical protein n=1 Tax=Microbacterium enclense TaxID=993073 RepID=UPI003F820868
MKRAMVATLLTAVILPALGGCAMNRSTYGEVREEALRSLEQVVEVIPDPKEVVPQAEGEPYPCDDPLLPTKKKGAFFTGHWFVYLPDRFNVDAFISSLAERLGEDWEERDLGVNVSFSQVDLLYKPSGFTVSVEDALTDGRPALELIVISRCGILPTDDKPRRSPGGRGV